VLINREAKLDEQGWPEHEHKLSVKANEKARLSCSTYSQTPASFLSPGFFLSPVLVLPGAGRFKSSGGMEGGVSSSKCYAWRFRC